MTETLKAWLRKPTTPEEEKRARQLTLEERREIENWLIPVLEDQAHSKANPAVPSV